MASPLPKRGLARLRQILQQPFALALMGISLCGCSFDLGSLTPEKEKPQEAPKAATTAENVVSAGNVSEAQAHTAKAQASPARRRPRSMNSITRSDSIRTTRRRSMAAP